MERRIFFASGLPRSGSTLLLALLRQNPTFVTGISSPVAEIFGTLQQALSARSEFYSMITPAKRQAILRGMIWNYFDDLPLDKIAVDLNRMWCGKLSALVQLFAEAKIFCCVRSLAWIYDSFERFHQKTALEPSRIYNCTTGGSVYSRTEFLNHPQNGLVGSSYNALREAFYGELGGRLMLINYESLTKRPETTLRALYEWLGEPYFPHDFNSVRFEASEYDKSIGAPGLHTIDRPVAFNNRLTILPPDLFKKFERTDFWQHEGQNPRKALVI